MHISGHTECRLMLQNIVETENGKDVRDIDVGDSQGPEVTAEMTSGQNVKDGEEGLK